MKKIILLFLFLFISVSIVRAGSLNTSIELTDVTTRNFTLKINFKHDSIRKICSFDFCDYMRGSNVNESLEIFTNNYLKTIKDDELKANLKVKGIKITKIILKKE